MAMLASDREVGTQVSYHKHEQDSQAVKHQQLSDRVEPEYAEALSGSGVPKHERFKQRKGNVARTTD